MTNVWPFDNKLTSLMMPYSVKLRIKRLKMPSCKLWLSVSPPTIISPLNSLFKNYEDTFSISKFIGSLDFTL